MKKDKTIYRDGISFKNWLLAVDKLLIAKCGMSHEDLPDYCWADEYECRASPRMAVESYYLSDDIFEMLNENQEAY